METQFETTKPLLNSSLKLRPAKWDDLEGVAKLILDVCTADGDPVVAVTAEELANEWKNPRFRLEDDAWVVETQEGQIVGYEEFYNRHGHASLQGDGYVHPEFMGQGIGTALLRSLDARARKEVPLAAPDLRVFIRNGMSIGDSVSCKMHEAEGYQAIRYSWRMEIKLSEPPGEPEWPEGIEIRPFDLEKHNRLVQEAHEEAFSDHWGHTPETLEQWTRHMIEREAFDPALWHIAWDGDQVAGYSLCRYRMGIGYVGTLGVRRAWRKQGLGMALLMHSFGDFYKRGMQTVGLGVDAQNPTGATRLYQKAGMQIAAEYVIYEKEFRAGREIDE
jgi:mycothiol synthase